MGRSYSSGVAVDKSNFSPDVAVRVAPVPQDDAARSRSSCAHVHVSSQVDAHRFSQRFGFLVRRAAYALARWCCLCVAKLSASDAASGAMLSADSAAWLASAFGSGTARQATSVPQRCSDLRMRSFRPRAAAALRCQRVFYALVWHTEFVAKSAAEKLNQTSDASDASLARAFGRISRVLKSGEISSVLI